MPGPYAPNDFLLGPVTEALKTTIQNEIPSIEGVFTVSTSRSVPDNQVRLLFLGGKILDETNGKQSALFKIEARHLFRLAELDLAISRAQSYLYPWLQMLAAWPNQHLTPQTRSVTTTDVRMSQVMEAGQAMLALLTDFNVLMEYNIPLT